MPHFLQHYLNERVIQHSLPLLLLSAETFYSLHSVISVLKEGGFLNGNSTLLQIHETKRHAICEHFPKLTFQRFVVISRHSNRKRSVSGDTFSMSEVFVCLFQRYWHHHVFRFLSLRMAIH